MKQDLLILIFRLRWRTTLNSWYYHQLLGSWVCFGGRRQLRGHPGKARLGLVLPELVERINRIQVLKEEKSISCKKNSILKKTFPKGEILLQGNPVRFENEPELNIRSTAVE